MPADFYTTEKRTLGVVLSNTTPPLRVPDYQRDFSWEEQQISEFWTDLTYFEAQYPGETINGKEYFLGAAVLVNNQTYHLILDGQQRLATATILLAAIRDKIREFNENAANQIQNSFISFVDHLGGGQLPKLQLNEFDRSFFRDWIQTFPRNPQAPPATKKSHKLILKAHEYLTQKVLEGWDSHGGGHNGFNWAARITKALTEHVSLVNVVSTDDDNAASIFETLNDRGIGLSTADLLRSWLLHRAPAADRQEIIECWSNVFDVSGVGAGAQTLIRLAWISRYGDVKERSLYKVISRKLTEAHTSQVEYSRQLRGDAQLFKRIREGDSTDFNESEAWQALSPLRAQSGYSLLIAASRQLNENDRKRISTALFSLIMRHNVICDKDRARFETTVFSAAKAIADGQGAAGAIALLRALSPSDAEVSSNFSRLSFGAAQSNVAQVVLRAIEYKLRQTEEIEVAPPERVHLEHIYPQKPEAADKLPNHDEYVGRIGNLTLLDRRLNQQAQNSGFIHKRDNFYNQSELRLTRELLTEDDWTPAKIDARQEHLRDIAMQIWPHNLVSD
jgi:hypothetical protein